MIRINLLPPAERPKKWSVNRIMIISLISVFFLCTCVFSYYSFILWHLECELTTMHNQYELLRPTQGAMIVTTSKQQIVNKKNDILISLSTKRKPWSGIITHLAGITTPGIWFSELSTTAKDQVKIVGIAENYQELATFLYNLEQNAYFSTPTLIHAGNSPNPAAPVTRFEIMTKFKGMTP